MNKTDFFSNMIVYSDGLQIQTGVLKNVTRETYIHRKSKVFHLVCTGTAFSGDNEWICRTRLSNMCWCHRWHAHSNNHSQWRWTSLLQSEGVELHCSPSCCGPQLLVKTTACDFFFTIRKWCAVYVKLYTKCLFLCFSFTDVYVDWPGCTHDAWVLTTCLFQN